MIPSTSLPAGIAQVALPEPCTGCGCGEVSNDSLRRRAFMYAVVSAEVVLYEIVTDPETTLVVGGVDHTQ
jgi:hypothetical protein